MIKKLFLIIIAITLVISGVQAISISKSEKEISNITKNHSLLMENVILLYLYTCFTRAIGHSGFVLLKGVMSADVHY